MPLHQYKITIKLNSCLKGTDSKFYYETFSRNQNVFLNYVIIY